MHSADSPPGARQACAPDLVREAVDAFTQLRDTPGDPDLGRLATAIYVEETFAITLSDDDIELLGTLPGLRSVLARHHQDV